MHSNWTVERLKWSAPPWRSRVGDAAQVPSGLNPVPHPLAGTITATTGTNNIQITAKDAAGNTTTHTWQVVATSGTNQTLTYDPDGNLLNDGTQTYEWDAANRLTAVNEPGNLRSEFTYDGLSRRVKIVEKSNGAVTSTKNLLWCGTEIFEERDASNNVTRRYYPQGMQLSGSNYFYTRDHLGSVRELTDSTGTIQARYSYDPYGRRTKLSGTLAANFGFTGDYWHVPSSLALTLYRAYNPDLGRWISRDPIGEDGGVNLYAYVENNPIAVGDLLGLLSDAAWNIAQYALQQAGGSLNSAWIDLKNQRANNPRCDALRDAEHFMFSAFMSSADGYGILGAVSMAIATPAYSGVKAALDSVGQLPSSFSSPSLSEVAAGYEGIGYSYNPSGNPPPPGPGVPPATGP